jgi:hypothetical protein
MVELQESRQEIDLGREIQGAPILMRHELSTARDQQRSERSNEQAGPNRGIGGLRRQLTCKQKHGYGHGRRAALH